MADLVTELLRDTRLLDLTRDFIIEVSIEIS